VNFHEDFLDSLALCRTRTPKVARLVERATDRVIREWPLDGMSPPEVEAWFSSVTFDPIRFRIEWPSDPLGDAL
jgi:hypothetical protein